MTIYFDLDRVLADFASQAEKYGVLKSNDKINWIKMFLIGSRFWSTMDFCPGAKESFFEISSYCRKNNIQVKILSSVRLASGKIGKIKWCREKLLLDKKDVIIVKRARQKATFADTSTLLIDDNKNNVQKFSDAGGYGFNLCVWDKATFNTLLKLIEDIYNGRRNLNK